jgi:hypothetical protein
MDRNAVLLWSWKEKEVWTLSEYDVGPDRVMQGQDATRRPVGTLNFQHLVRRRTDAVI